MGLKVINKSPEKADIQEEQAFSTLTYKGDLHYGADSKLIVEIVDVEGNITDLRVTPTCGCTVANTSKSGNVYTAEIVYDTQRRGSFTKQLQVPFKEQGKNKKYFITIKGRVI